MSSILESLPEGEIDLDYSSASSALGNWKSGISGINIDAGEITGAFSPLTSLGIMDSTIPKIAEGLNQAITSLKSLVNGINVSVDDHNDFDNSTSNNTNNFYDNNQGSPTGGGGGYVDTSADNSTQEVTINKDLLSSIKSLDGYEFDNLSVALYSLVKSDRSLDSLLTNEKYADLIKEKILKSIKSKELKKALNNLDATVIQKTLLHLLNKGTGLIDKSSKNITYTYLEALANKNNLKLTDFVSNKKLLSEAYIAFATTSNSLSDIMSDSDMTKLKTAYESNGLTGLIVKDAVDSYAKEKNVEAGDILSNTAYLDGVKDALGKYVKSFDYISMAAYSSSDISKEVMNYIIGGNK